MRTAAPSQSDAQAWARLRGLPVWMILLPAVLLALVLGLGSAVLPVRILALLVGMLVVIPLWIWRPAWLIVPAIAAEMYLPSQPVADVVSVIFFVRASVSLLARWDQVSREIGARLLLPVYAIALFAVLSFTVAVTMLDAGKSPVYQDGRVFVYLLWLVPLLAYAPVERPFAWIARQLVIVAGVVSLLAIVQGVFGIALVQTGRVGQLETLGQFSSGITRVQIPGFVFVTFAIFYTAAQLAQKAPIRLQIARTLMLAVFLLAVVFNFGRAIWFWVALGLMLTALLMGWRAVWRMGLLLTLSTAVLVSVIVVSKPRLADSMVERVTSVIGEGGSRTSFGWRTQENQNALAALQRSSLLGVGLGGDYRMPVFGLRQFENHTRYIHNGHLSLMLKLSVLGYVCYVVLFGLCFAAAKRMRAEPAARSFAVASIVWLLMFAGQNITQPDIMTAPGLAMLMAVVVALALGLRRRQAPQRQWLGRHAAGPLRPGTPGIAAG